MPRQIPLKRARGSDEDSIGCGAAYLQFIGTILAIGLALWVLQVIADNIEFLVSAFLVVAGICFVIFAIQERAQVLSWLVSVEEQIEQWARDEKRFALVVVFFSILICLILAIFGIVALQKG